MTNGNASTTDHDPAQPLAVAAGILEEPTLELRPAGQVLEVTLDPAQLGAITGQADAWKLVAELVDRAEHVLRQLTGSAGIKARSALLLERAVVHAKRKAGERLDALERERAAQEETDEAPPPLKAAHTADEIAVLMQDLAQLEAIARGEKPPGLWNDLDEIVGRARLTIEDLHGGSRVPGPISE